MVWQEVRGVPEHAGVEVLVSPALAHEKAATVDQRGPHRGNPRGPEIDQVDGTARGFADLAREFGTARGTERILGKDGDVDIAGRCLALRGPGTEEERELKVLVLPELFGEAVDVVFNHGCEAGPRMMNRE